VWESNCTPDVSVCQATFNVDGEVSRFGFGAGEAGNSANVYQVTHRKEIVRVLVVSLEFKPRGLGTYTDFEESVSFQ
jgi:hypothetical protein